MECAIGPRSDGVVVADDQQGHTAADARVLQQLEHELGGLGVEGPGRLVGQQKPWIVGQRAGDGDPLALAARQVHRERFEPMPEPDLLQQCAGLLAAGRCAESGADQRNLDVDARREMGE